MQEQEAERSATVGVGPVEPHVEDRIAALRGRGQPLPASEQTFFSERIGHSFADVRIHNDSESDNFAQSLGAEAFTTGSDIVFRQGAFSSGDTRSRRLVAHELTHVIQQTSGQPIAGQSGTEQTGDAVQRRPAADGGVCPVCGKVGKGTCPDCGAPFLPAQHKASPETAVGPPLAAAPAAPPVATRPAVPAPVTVTPHPIVRTAAPQTVPATIAPAPASTSETTPAASTLDAADAAVEQVLRKEAQRPDVMVQRFGLGEVADALMPDWVEDALDALRGDARSQESELTDAGSADKSMIEADAQTKSAEIQNDGDAKGAEVQGDGRTKGAEVQSDGQTKGTDVQDDGDAKGAEVHGNGQNRSTELQGHGQITGDELQNAQWQQSQDLQDAQDQQAIDLQTAQDQQATDLQTAQDQQVSDLQTAQDQQVSDLQAEAEREQAGIDAEAQSHQSDLQRQYTATEQAVQQRQTALSSEVEQRAIAIQSETHELEDDTQARWASLQGEAHATIGTLNDQAADLCASAQQQAQAFLDTFDPLIGDAQASWQKIQAEAKQGWDGLMQQAQPMLDALQSKWSAFSTWFSSESWPVIQQKATELGQFVSGQATQAWSWLQKQWGNLTAAWNNAEGIIQGKADAARAWIAGRVETAQAWVGGKADAARTWINDKADAARSLIGDKADAARVWISDKADAARLWIGDKADAARVWIGDKADAARMWMGERADAARLWIGKRGDAAKTWIGERGNAARTWIDNKSTLTQQWLQGRALSITTTFQETGNGLVGGLACKARGAVGAITSGGGPIMQWFGSIVNGLIGGVERAGRGAVNLASGALSGGLGVVERTAQGAAHGLNGLAAGAVNTVQGAATGAMNTVQGAATGAVNGVETLGSGAVTTVENAATGAVNSVETVGNGAVTTVEGAATTAVNGVQALSTSAVTFVEDQAQEAVNTVETAVNGAVGAVGVVGQGVVTGLEQQALGVMTLARTAWDDIQRTWNATTRAAGETLGWLGEQASRLGNWLSTEVFPRLSQWASEQWTHLSGWVAEQLPGLTACWNAFEQFADASWTKIQQVPLVGDYLRINAELLEGMLAGDALQDPTALNVVGQVLIGFTPIGWLGDARDIGLALHRLATGEGNGVDALLALAAVVPGLDALKGLKGGAKLLDHTDEATEGLRLLHDALKGLPSGVAGGILKNPALMEQLARNPKLLEEALRRGDEGLEALTRGGEDGLGAFSRADDNIDEMARWGKRFNTSNTPNSSTFSSNYEGLEWFNERYINDGNYHPIARLRGDYFGPKLQGARSDIIEQSLDEIDYLMQHYPEASANLENIAVVNSYTPYPTGSEGRIFEAHAAAISGKDSLLIKEIWLNKEIFGYGQLLDEYIKTDGGRSVAFPRGDIVNFSALMSHEYGHAVHRWIQSSGFHNEILDEMQTIIGNNIENLKKLTPASFDYRPTKIPSEIFAELFASRRIIQEFYSGFLPEHLMPHTLVDEDIQKIVVKFGCILDNLVAKSRNL
ncbi:MAG TPA: DUF4157 domain-containing protein [Roseiflexaceae bacterium]|nr:DUF4157 domain-containing protein [Roseiflexaceae bacterium]